MKNVLGLLPIFLLLASGPPSADAAKLTLIHGGDAIDCRVEALVDAATLRIVGAAGGRLIKLADIQQIDYAAADGRPAGALVVEPNGGSRLLGRMVGGDPSAFQLQVRGLGKLSLPLDKIRVAVNGDVDGGATGPPALAEARRTRRDQDVMFLAVEKNIRTFPTLVRRLDEKGAQIQWSDGTRAVEWNRIYAIVFATLNAPDTAAPPARAILIDGSIVAGSVAAFSDSLLTMTTEFAGKLAIPVAELARVEFTSEKLVYLSDLTAASIEKAGFYGQPWPVRLDISLTGRPLALGKIVYKKGIACHSRTAITYTLDGKYKTFAAVIGIDPEAGGPGNCIFRVADGTGKVLFDSGDVAAKDPPKAVNVDISGVQQLVLTVDFGKDKDLGDNAIWADARVIKP